MITILALYVWADKPVSPVQADPAPVPEALNTNADVDSGADAVPQIAADSSGVWIAVWDSDDSLGGAIGTDTDIIFARSTDGIEWSAPAALNTNAGSDTQGDGFPSLATDDSGTWIVAWSSKEDLGGTGADSEILFSRSTDGGLTWPAPAILNSNASVDSDDDLFPKLATDGLGNWVAVWNSHIGAGTDSDIVTARSSDNGLTWSAPAPLNDYATTDSAGDDVPHIATDGSGTWVAAWSSTYNGGGTDTDYDIWMARSVDAGATWSSATPLNTNALTDSGFDGSFRGLGLANDGGSRWVAAWPSDDDLGGTIGTDFDILTATSSDDGVTWTAPLALNTDADTDIAWDSDFGRGATLVTDGSGNWAAVWPRGSVLTATEMVAARSTDNGATWEAPVSINRAPSGDNIQPHGAYASGSWNFVWTSNDNLDGIIGTDYDILRYNCLGDGRLDCIRDLPRLVVTETGDGADASPGDSVCETAGLSCSLRAAIEESNALGGARIYFRIAGAGPHVISPASALPALTAPAVIDGMTEPDFMGTPVVRIDGSSLSSGGLQHGLEVDGGTSTVKGLSITGFTGGPGIDLAFSDSNVVTGNFLGIAPDGTTGAGNVNGVVAGNTLVVRVGGPTVYERNVVSGNSQVGVAMLDVSGGEIEGNYIGTDAAGTSAVANGAGIIIVASSSNVTISSNVISGNDVISVSSGAGLSFGFMAGTGHVVRGNRIGTAANGFTPLGNGGDGVRFTGGTDNFIGGLSPGDGNIIAFNAGHGVRIEGAPAIRNTIRGNSIHSNAGLGIENVGGGNTELTPPVITISLPDSTFGTACANCAVDVYQDFADEGRFFVGSTTADSAGNWALMAPPLSTMINLTATATDAAGNTSEFSAPVPPGDADSDGVPDVAEGECGDSVDSDGNGFVNDGCPQVGATAESGVECDNNLDDDGDGWVNDGCPSAGTEGAACHSQTGDGNSIPERIDGPFAGQDDDGDTLIDEALPVGAENFDCDGDGYTGSAEDHVFSYAAQTDGDQKTCGEYDTNFSTLDPNQTAATPSLRWPSDFRTAGIPNSTNRINILDLASVVVPVRYLGTNVGAHPGDVRFDISPGKGPLSTDINILDLAALTAPGSATGSPPMLGGARAFLGPECPWPE